MSMLGLCLNLPKSGRPELVFYGSPLTVMLAYLLEMEDMPDMLKLRLSALEHKGYVYLTVGELQQLGVFDHRMVNASEYHEARSYLVD
jgi:hypothetical protein